MIIFGNINLIIIQTNKINHLRGTLQQRSMVSLKKRNDRA